METLVSQLTPQITIDTNVVDGDNWKLTMCRTYWMLECMEITIGGELFTVEEVSLDEYIIVSGTAQPVGATFSLEAPQFYHGSRRKVSGEMDKIDDLTKPFVYLPRPTARENNDVQSDISYVAQVRPIFLTGYLVDRDSIDMQQIEIIEPMNEMADLFVWLIEDQLDKFNDPSSNQREEWMNFGDPTVWGNEELIFDRPCSGVELRLEFDVLREYACLCEGKAPNVCPDVTHSFQGYDTGITTFPGGNLNVSVVDDLGVDTGTKISEDANNIVIEVTGAGSTLDVSLNGTLLRDDVSTDQNITVFAAGSGANVGHSDGGDWEVSDSVVSNSDDSYLINLGAEQPLELPDITHTQTDGSPEILPAQTPLVCDPAADADNQVNGAAKVAIPSGGSKNFVIRYENDDPVVVTQVSDSATEFVGEIPDIPVPGRIYIRPKNTNSSAEYFTFDDFWKKSNNIDTYVPPSSGTPMLLDPSDPKLLIPDNIFNHKFVITGSTGGYYDHLTSDYKDAAGTITTKALAFPLDYYINHHTGLGGLINFVAGSPQTVANSYPLVDALTAAGFSDYYIPNINEALAQTNIGDDIGFTSQSNYPPFDGMTTDQRWSSTRYFNGANTLMIQSGGTVSISNDSTAQSIIVMRYHFT